MKSRFEVSIWDAAELDPKDTYKAEYCVMIDEYSKVPYLPDNTEVLEHHVMKTRLNSRAEADTYAREFIEKLNREDTYE